LSLLQNADPPLRFAPDVWSPLATVEDTLKGAALKTREDGLDAITCAYIALYHARWGDTKSTVVGDMEVGYIVTPVTEELRACFEARTI
jgi:predicted RNase H-like nuclease